MTIRLTRRLLAAFLLLCLLPMGVPAQQSIPQTDNPLRIGTIGAGDIGGLIGTLFAKAGHRVFFSSRHPDELQPLVDEAGPNTQAGTVAEAIAFGDVILLSVPYGAMPQISRDYADALAGKVVLDTGNPNPRRDGPMAEPALEKGAGIATAEYLPGARVVRAFNSIRDDDFRSEAHRPAPRLAVPLAGDDREAVEIAAQLVRDAGFEPVIVGPLEAGRRFDRGSSVYVKTMTAAELREALDLN